MSEKIREQRRLKLLEIMANHNLTNQDVADIINEYLGREHKVEKLKHWTIEALRKPETSKSSNPINKPEYLTALYRKYRIPAEEWAP